MRSSSPNRTASSGCVRSQLPPHRAPWCKLHPGPRGPPPGPPPRLARGTGPLRPSPPAGEAMCRPLRRAACGCPAGCARHPNPPLAEQPLHPLSPNVRSSPAATLLGALGQCPAGLLTTGKPRRPLVSVGPGCGPPRLRRHLSSTARRSLLGQGLHPRATSPGLDGLWAAPAPLPLASRLRLAPPPRPW